MLRRQVHPSQPIRKDSIAVQRTWASKKVSSAFSDKHADAAFEVRAMKPLTFWHFLQNNPNSFAINFQRRMETL